MTDNDPPIDPIDALKQVRVLLFVASERDDMDAVQKHIEMAQAIIAKALPRKKGGQRV
jgi:hypothetical protein